MANQCVTFEYNGPKYAIIGPAGYYVGMDSWGNPRFTQDKKKAFFGLFGDCQNEIAIRGLAKLGVEIRAI